MRDVDEFRNSALLGDTSNGFDTGDMHGVEIKVPDQVRLIFVTK